MVEAPHPVATQTLGQRCHYDAHFRQRRVRAQPGYDLPDVKGRDYEAAGAGTTSHRSRIYPPKELVDAIDRRAGWATQEDAEAEQRFLAALLVLATVDPVACELVHVVCRHGEWRFSRRGTIEHLAAYEQASAIIAGERGVTDRTVLNWLTDAWALLGVLTADDSELRRAIREETETRAAWERLQREGVL